MKLKPAQDVLTAPVVTTGLIGGFVAAQETGIRPLGGLLLGAGYLLGFGMSHPLAKKIGAWPAVLAVTAAAAGASWVLSDRG